MPPYQVLGGLTVLAGVSPPVIIDLLGWQSRTDTTPPYPHLYQLGLARMALATGEMHANLAELAEKGVEVVGPPARVLIDDVSMGWRFVFFKDPDGTVLELVEIAGMNPPA